jgi:uncharacterized membrane protein
MLEALKHPRRTFVAGFLVLLPLIVTILILGFVFQLLDGLGISALIETIAGRKIPGLGTAITLAFVFLVGLTASSGVGARALRSVERVLLRVPFVRSIYGPAKQLFDMLGRDQGTAQEVVMVEYPRHGLFMVGFVTHRDASSVSVFLPTTPNPTSGFLVLCKPSEVHPLPMGFQQAMNFIVSGGVVRPSESLLPGLAKPGGGAAAG